jgi:hypothetical protein
MLFYRRRFVCKIQRSQKIVFPGNKLIFAYSIIMLETCYFVYVRSLNAMQSVTMVLRHFTSFFVVTVTVCIFKQIPSILYTVIFQTAVGRGKRTDVTTYEIYWILLWSLCGITTTVHERTQLNQACNILNCDALNVL